MSEQISGMILVKRTFEGSKDPTKNDDPVTSKYMPSHKIAVVYTKNGKRAVETFATRADARKWIDAHCHQGEL